MADMDAGTLRQRRNLITVSLISLMYMFAGGSIKSLLGVEITNELMVKIFMVLAFIYCLWRYFIYTSESNMSGLLDMDIRKYIVDNKYYINLINKKMKEQDVAYVSNNESTYSGIFIANTDDTKDSWSIILSKDIKLRLYYNTGADNKSYSTDAIISPWEMCVLKSNMLMRSALLGKTFTDYMLPYLLALLTVIIFVIRVTF